MEAWLRLEEIPKAFATVFTATFCRMKSVSEIPPEPKMNAKSAGMSQGSGSANARHSRSKISALLLAFD